MPAPMQVDGKLMPEVFIVWASEGVFRDKGEAEKSGLDLRVNVTKLLKTKSNFESTN